jgi:hypothetical protein
VVMQSESMRLFGALMVLENTALACMTAAAAQSHECRYSARSKKEVLWVLLDLKSL